jgi:hypothetical protein
MKEGAANMTDALLPPEDGAITRALIDMVDCGRKRPGRPGGAGLQTGRNGFGRSPSEER